ncbi:MAG: sugar phosphate nucleotidyltransferase, partial [Angelakisella sp.]
MPDNKMLGIVFSNMHDDFLSELTLHRTTASVPFGGRYRLIDFTLSNMVNSGIDRVGIIAKSNYHSLMDHVGSGKEWDLARKRGGLTILPPFSRTGAGMYRGNLDALYGVSAYIKTSQAKYVLICDCDVIANADFTAVLEAHKASGAGITLVYGRENVTPEIRDDMVTLDIGADGFLLDAMANPQQGGEQNVYLNAAVFDRELLLRLVGDGVSHEKYSIQDILQEQARARTV